MNTNYTANKAAPQAPIANDDKFNYGQWEWSLLKPPDLFTPANELTITEERVAMRMHAHANTTTGFVFVTAQRIASLMERDRGPGKSRRGGSVNAVQAARAVLRRRGFIEPGFGKDPRGNVRKGYYLKSSAHWLHRSGAKNDALAGPKKTLSDGVFFDEDNSVCASEKLCPTEFRTGADNIEGTSQELLPFHQHHQPGAAAHADDAAIEEDDQEKRKVRAALAAQGIEEPTLTELVSIPDLRQWHIAQLTLTIVGARSHAAVLVVKIRSGGWRQLAEPLATPENDLVRANAEARFEKMSKAEKWGIVNGGLLARNPGLALTFERHRSAGTDPFADDQIRGAIMQMLPGREELLVDTIDIDLENKTS